MFELMYIGDIRMGVLQDIMIIYGCIFLAVIIVDAVRERRKKENRKISSLKFMETAIVLLLFVFSVMSGLMTNPVKLKVLVYIFLSCLAFLFTRKGKKEFMKGCECGVFLRYNTKLVAEMMAEGDRLTKQEKCKNRRRGEEELKKWKPLWFFFIPALLPVAALDIMTLLVHNGYLQKLYSFLYDIYVY